MSGTEGVLDPQDGQYLPAEYKDDQLQIVEVTPFNRDRGTHMPELSDGNQTKYMQIVDAGKGLVQLDLLNLTFVRCEDGDGSYQLLANTNATEGEVGADNTVTCVLQSSDNEDPENQESYMVMGSENDDGSLVFLQSALQPALQKKNETKNTQPTPAEILEKAKALQKAKGILSQTTPRRRGKKRKGDLPPPHELLASPNFKLYLYSCKLCNFKCNAVKEMSAHKASEHGNGGRSRMNAGRSGATLQCAGCPYRASTHSQLMRHVRDRHLKNVDSDTVRLNTSEVEAADILVCGACGFESSSKLDFKMHIEDEHGATTC